MTTKPGKEVVVLVFIRSEEEILLVRQNYGKKFWSLPGGMVEPGESLTAAAIREVKEETGLDISIMNVVGIYSKPKDDSVAITLEGLVLGGNLRADNEILECRYFPSDNLPNQVREHFHQRAVDFFANRENTFLRSQ